MNARERKILAEAREISARLARKRWAASLRKLHKARTQSAMFNVYAQNGLNFNKSVNDPNSRLARVVNYIRKNGPASRRSLCLMLGMDPSKESRGWGTFLWSTAVKAQLLVKVRNGRQVLYHLGPNARWVTLPTS